MVQPQRNYLSEFDFEENINVEAHVKQGDAKIIYRSKIVETNKLQFKVNMQIEEDDPFKLNVGQIIDVKFFGPDAYYIFKAQFEEVDPENKKLMTLVQVSQIKRVQQRAFSRIDVSGTVKFRCLGNVGVNQNKARCWPESKWENGEALNVSANGILIQSKEHLRAGDILQLNIQIDDLPSLTSLTGIVERINPPEKIREDKSLQHVGIYFMNQKEFESEYKDTLGENTPDNDGFIDMDMQKDLLRLAHNKRNSTDKLDNSPKI